MLSNLRLNYGDNIVADRFGEATLRIDECTVCGLVFHRFVGTDDFLELVYNEWLNVEDPKPTHDLVFQNALRNPAQSRDRIELEIVSREVGTPISALRILDYGMGWGRFPAVAHLLGATSYGFDLSEERQRWGAAHGVEVVSLDDIPGLELDYIVLEQVLEHVLEPGQLFRILASGLRPGGVCKVSVPYGADIRSRLERADWTATRGPRHMACIQPPEHINCFSRATLRDLGRRAGLVSMRPRFRSFFGFLTQRDAWPMPPREVAKGLLRPVYNQFSPVDTVVYFLKPA